VEITIENNNDKFDQLKNWLIDTDSGFGTLLEIQVQPGQQYTPNSTAYQKVLKNCIKSNLIGAPIKTNAIEVLQELKKIACMTMEELKRTCICCLKRIGVNEVFQHGICETKSVIDWNVQNRPTSSQPTETEIDEEVPLISRRRQTSVENQDTGMEEAAAILSSITDT